MMQSSGATEPVNVILISFDTLRKDYLSCLGNPKPLSPQLDRLAESGVLFSDAVVNCGWTLPQHITMITGTHPLKHRLIYLERHRNKLRKPIGTLAEIFRSRGYLCFGFANGNELGGGWQYGFSRGMHQYTTIFPMNNMMELLPDAVSWALNMAKSTPFFFYIHTNDTHEPFAASSPFGLKWGTKYVNRYEGEVSYVDDYFGTILSELDRKGIRDNTLIVATSDHGTEFLEHGFLEKKLNLYDEISRVPLIFSLPTLLPSKMKIEGLTETIDIAPTILDICGLSVPNWMDGKSLLPRMSGYKDATSSDHVVAHTLHERFHLYEHFSIRNERYKLISTTPMSKHPHKLRNIYHPEMGKRFKRLFSIAKYADGKWWELYDLKENPEETENIIDSEPNMISDLEKTLNKYFTSFGYAPKTARTN